MDNFILQTVNNNISGKSNSVSSCFYCEIFEGGFFDYHAKNKCDFYPNSGYDKITASKTRGEVSYDYSIYRSDTTFWKKIYPMSFEKNFAIGQSKTITITVPYQSFVQNIANGTFLENKGSFLLNLTLSKGFLIRLYTGFYSDDSTAGVYQDDDGQHTIRQFTGIINDISPSEKDGTITISASDYSVIFLNQLNYNYPDIISYRDAPEDTIDVTVGGSTYKSPIRIQPENLFLESANQQFVPAYDNWKVTDAIRDLCIKTSFPVERINFDFQNKEKQRLGKANEYPFMKTQSKYVQTSKTTIEEMVQIAGIDTESLDKAKYKLDFGKNLWDCMTSICEDFGYRLFFDEDGILNIKDVDAGEFFQSFSGTELQIIESHIYGWLVQDISNGSCSTVNNKSNCKIEARFVSGDTELSFTTIDIYIGQTCIKQIPLRALNKYDFETLVLFESESPSGEFTIKCSSSAYLNCLFYYDEEMQNAPIISLDSTKNSKITQAVLSSQEIRNQVICIGKPLAEEPLISKAVDYTSIYGGQNIISKIVYNNGSSNITQDKGGFFTNGKKDKYAKALFHPHLFDVYCFEVPRIIKLYLKPDKSYIGKTIYVASAGVNIYKVIEDSDLTNAGMVFHSPSGTMFQGSYHVNISCDDVDIYISEVEIFTKDPSYNYVGYLKEMIIVKDNVSDKATNDWTTKAMIEAHRGNSHTVQAEAIGIPFLKVGNCVDIYAPELGFANDKKFYITSITENGSDISYVSKISLSAIPPTKSILYIPDVDSSKFTNDIYDFTIQIKEKKNISGDEKGVIGGEFERIANLPGNMKKYKYGRVVAYDSVNNKLYVMGGSSTYSTYNFANSLTPTKEFAVYDFSTKQWTLGEMPNATCFTFAGFYDGNLYVFGGMNQVNKVMKYTVSSGVWSVYHTASEAAMNHHCGSGVVVNGKAYYIGGWRGQIGTEGPEYPGTPSSCIFDIANKTVSSMASVESDICSYGIFMNQSCVSNDGNWIYSYGGSYRDHTYNTDTWNWKTAGLNIKLYKRYNISGNYWENINTPESGLVGGTIFQTSDGSVCAAGGYKNSYSGKAESSSVYKIANISGKEELLGGIQETFGISSAKVANDKIAMVGESVYITDLAKMAQSKDINIVPIDDYCLFSFATTKRRKITILVKHPTENKIFAWPLEETVIEPGVYKRENGIRWDFGLDFEQRFGDYVDKIFLYPNDSDDNYVYSTIYDNLETTNEYDPAVTHSKTPSFYIVRVTTKLDKYLLNTLGGETVSSDLQIDIPLVTTADKYKDGTFSIGLEDVFPTSVQIGGSVICPITVKRNNSVAVPNDMVYVDVIVQAKDGSNVNQITQTKDSYGRYPSASQRNIITAALIDDIRWDLTDSSGIFVPAGTGNQYKFKIVNAFGVNGEAVSFVIPTGINLLPNPGFNSSSTSETVTVPAVADNFGRVISLATSAIQVTKKITGWTAADSSGLFTNSFKITPISDYSKTTLEYVPAKLDLLTGVFIASAFAKVTNVVCPKPFGYSIKMNTESEKLSISLYKYATIAFTDYNWMVNSFYSAMSYKRYYGPSLDYYMPHIISSEATMPNPIDETQDVYVSFEYQFPGGGPASYYNSKNELKTILNPSDIAAIEGYGFAPVFFLIYQDVDGFYCHLSSDMIKLSKTETGVWNVAGAKFTIPKQAGLSEIKFRAGAFFGAAYLLTTVSDDPNGKPSGYVASLLADPVIKRFVDYNQNIVFNPWPSIDIDNFQAIIGSEYRKIQYITQPKDNNKTSTLFEVLN